MSLQKPEKTPTPGLIVVLGSPNSKTGELFSVAKARCELALQEYAKRPGWKFLLTGGYGAHFNTTAQPHAEYLKIYLIQKGVPETAIVEFAKSTNTLQDASLARPIIRKYKVMKILVITSDYHLERAHYVFRKEFKDTGIKIEFSVTQTNEADCEFDLSAQKEHEREALLRLQEEIERQSTPPL